ncbi:cytochrome-c peroxidase [Psychroserpens sp.]|uniref:cytochrome-c peroxidase n=1 Tax=Psychroserpens sp. TaxID=2020870 RepID=UPI001B0FC1CB|nr:cytochrome c peroxidase [Psychroserpens sp.]MBO6607829.1 cytochrome-c peroxidase [Psychroserpens sp.]MBO6630652.1 cytochrome-c peroxidase [Psychroserpens sp.]MBO6654820.1 cytochrome-c peroxidase [Psychroserpens sp.]MBO6682756.1 cytochrome-c peroxidase [Psychroserpens sp.]MBO6751187.1 cytochrome-c peroxidase [Psychroserpens sp.]
MKLLKFYQFVLCLGLCSAMSCASDDNYVDVTPQSELELRLIELYGSKDAMLLPLSTDFDAIPSDINNPITEAKVALGKLLFHETGLAKNPNMDESMNTYSCASCHHSKAGFQSGVKQGIGEGGIGFGVAGEGRHKNPMYLDSDMDVQPIRSPSVLNAAYQEVMLWNGQFGATGINQGTEANWTIGTPKETNNLGFQGVETQAIAGLDVHRLMIDEAFVNGTDYKDMFDAAFPDIPAEERYTKITAGLAIAAYERTVLPNQSPFQQWMRGDEAALNESEMNGAMLFFDKANCFACHSGPGLNGMDFHAIGMNDLAGNDVVNDVDDATKRGRGGFTGNPLDDYKFKTPQLYNLTDVGFFGHGGSFTSVRAVIEYKNNAVKENTEVSESALSPLFTSLNLTESEIDDIVAFLETGLYDSNLSRYAPDELPSGNCFPNADDESSVDMGCD